MESVVGSLMNSFPGMFGVKDVDFHVVSEGFRVAFEHVAHGGGVDVPIIVTTSSAEVSPQFADSLRIAGNAYFTRADAWRKAADDVSGASADAWLESDCLRLAIRDEAGALMAFISVGGMADGRLPARRSVEFMSLFSQLLSVALVRERERVEKEAQSTRMVHRTDLLEDVLRISSSIVSERDLKKLSSMILTSVSTLFGFERVTLVVYDEALGAFRWVALYGYPDEAVRESRVRSVPMDVILEDLRESRRIGRTVYYTPVEEVSPRQLSHFVMPERALAAKASGERSPGEFREGDSLAFSLHDSNGRIVGVIYPSMPRGSRIPDADTIETIEIFTSLAEVAIENAHLSIEKEVALRVSGQRAEQMSRIFDLITDMLYVRDLDQLFADVLKMLSQLLGVRRMLISVLDKQAGAFRARAVHGYPEDRTEAIKRIEYPVSRINFILDPKGKPVSDTPVKWRKKVGRMTYYVPAEGYTVLPDDMVYYPEPELIRLPRKGEGYWHELDYLDTFIFDREGEVVAYIEFNKPRDDRIPDSDTIEVVEIFASLAGVAMENATMFEAQIESRKSAEFYTDLLSHDIKNFNQAILGYLDMLKSTLTLPEQVAMAGKLSQQVLNIGRLASNVRTMSRLTWDSSKLVRTDLDAVLLDCMASVPQYYMSRKMVFKHELSAGKHHVMADGLMKELFVNLMTNAVKYDHHEPVEIELRVERVQHDDHASWLVSVADRGRGVPDDMKDKIFGRFVQGSAKKGSGLGLHIVSMLTKNYHGRAWVEDRVPGDHTQGAVFKVELPLVE